MEEKNIIITTGDLKEDHEILDIVAIKEQTITHWKRQAERKSEETTLNKIKQELKCQCIKLGGDAIINCQIKYYGLGSSIHYLSVAGTIVKIKSKN